MEDMSWEEFSRINIRAPELPGVTADMGEVRVYPYGGAFAHVIGYVAKVSDRDLTAAKDPTQIRFCSIPASASASQGVEKAFDSRAARPRRRHQGRGRRPGTGGQDGPRGRHPSPRRARRSA
jgi:penicillin-binding protein 2